MAALPQMWKELWSEFCEQDPGMALQVATEWLFSVPDHILHKHLASDPNTPVAEVSSPEDHRVCGPRRIPLQVNPTRTPF